MTFPADPRTIRFARHDLGVLGVLVCPHGRDRWAFPAQLTLPRRGRGRGPELVGRVRAAHLIRRSRARKAVPKR